MKKQLGSDPNCLGSAIEKIAVCGVFWGGSGCFVLRFFWCLLWALCPEAQQPSGQPDSSMSPEESTGLFSSSTYAIGPPTRLLRFRHGRRTRGAPVRKFVTQATAAHHMRQGRHPTPAPMSPHPCNESSHCSKAEFTTPGFSIVSMCPHRATCTHWARWPIAAAVSREMVGATS